LTVHFEAVAQGTSILGHVDEHNHRIRGLMRLPHRKTVRTIVITILRTVLNEG
jgi:hypothetical protein